MTETSTPDADWVHALAALEDPIKEGHVEAGQRRYRYMTLPQLAAEVRVKMGAHGWAFTQEPYIDDGVLSVWTMFWHTSGMARTFGPFTMAVGRSPHEVGSALTYARRYHLASIVGLAGDDDDDAQHAQQAAQQRRTPAAEREAMAQTKPVTRGRQRASDDDQRMWQATPPEPPPALRPEPPTLTFYPFEGDPPSDAQKRKMWVVLGDAGAQSDEEKRETVATIFGLDPAGDWHMRNLSKRAVSAVITRLQPEDG